MINFASEYVRSLDEVRSMIKLAKLSEKHLTDVTQVVYYGDAESSSNWKLLELNPNLLKAINEGETLSFKGWCQLSLNGTVLRL